jgi:hypothetical protein
MHVVSEIGAGRRDDLGPPRLMSILSSVRQNPALPLTLRCNVSAAYAYQNPGHHLDTPEGELYNARRDLRILQRLELVPDDTRPAIELFRRLLENMESAQGILWFDEAPPAPGPENRARAVTMKRVGRWAWRPSSPHTARKIRRRPSGHR